jgi:protein ImuA
MRSDALVPASALARVAADAPGWRPGLRSEGEVAHHSEVFASGRETSGAAVALALAADAVAEMDDTRALLWVQDRAALKLGGRPYRPGLPRAWRNRVIHVIAEKAEDALFAIEEGLRCRDLATVVGEIAGNPKALDFTASRRLTLAAERHGVPLWLVRLDAARDLSSARMRWDVRAAPSQHPRWNAAAPGAPAWRAELFRARAHPPGEWVLGEESSGRLQALRDEPSRSLSLSSGRTGGVEKSLLPFPVRPEEGLKPKAEGLSRRTS